MNRAKTTRRDFLTLAAALGAWPASAQTGGRSDAASGAAGLAAFDEVWETVRDRFYDPRLHGLDWQAVRARYRPQAAPGRSRDETAAVINAMLGGAPAPPTRATIRRTIQPITSLPTSSPTRCVVAGLERVFPAGEVTYPGIGVFTQADDSGPDLHHRGGGGRARSSGGTSGWRRNPICRWRPVSPGRLLSRQGWRRRAASHPPHRR